MATSIVDDELRILIEDFDHHSPEFVRRYRDVYAYMHTLDRPVLRAHRYGGFWVFAGHAACLEIQSRNDVFSNAQITIPQTETPALIPAFQDMPDHAEYRRVLGPQMSPLAVSRNQALIAEMKEKIFNDIKGRPNFDVVRDISQALVGRFTMALLGLNPDEYDDYAEPFHNVTFGHGSHEEHIQQFMRIRTKVKEHVAAMRNNPQGLIGVLVQATHFDRPLRNDEVEAMVLNLLAGGLGTTGGFVGSVAVHLGRNPELRQILIEEPELIDTTALDEFLRWYSPTPSMAKLATQDYELEGVTIPKGEMVMLALGGANLDPLVFEDPMTVDVRRKNLGSALMSFGIGPHRCLGSHIGKAISRACIKGLLEYAPSYSLVESELQIGKSFAHIQGYRSVPVLAN